MIAITIQPKSEGISPNVIVQGEINKYLLYRSEECELSLLELFPGASIKVTKKEDDCKEFYFFVKSKCLKLSEHGFEVASNYTNEALHIIYVKMVANANMPYLDEILKFC